MSKPSKAQKIRDYIASHPDKSVKQVASALRVIPAYVYKIKSELKPKKLILNRTQVEVANKLGIPTDVYAEQVYKLTSGRKRPATREEKISNPGVYEVPAQLKWKHVTVAPKDEALEGVARLEAAQKLENVTADALDRQVGGAHYKNRPIQPVEYSFVNKLNGLEASIVKRITRWRDKDGFQDLEKIKHEVDLLIELEKKYGSNA